MTARPTRIRSEDLPDVFWQVFFCRRASSLGAGNILNGDSHVETATSGGFCESDYAAPP